MDFFNNGAACYIAEIVIESGTDRQYVDDFQSLCDYSDREILMGFKLLWDSHLVATFHYLMLYFSSQLPIYPIINYPYVFFVTLPFFHCIVTYTTPGDSNLPILLVEREMEVDCFQTAFESLYMYARNYSPNLYILQQSVFAA